LLRVRTEKQRDNDHDYGSQTAAYRHLASDAAPVFDIRTLTFSAPTHNERSSFVLLWNSRSSVSTKNAFAIF
jgi:hypothetical protein